MKATKPFYKVKSQGTTHWLRGKKEALILQTEIGGIVTDVRNNVVRK